MNAARLTVTDLSMRFGGVTAIDRLSFHADANAITALIGPNGAGKTTVFNCLTGFYRPSGGTLQLIPANGKPKRLERMPGYKIARDAGIVRTFQNIRLFAGMSVLENLMVAQHAAMTRTPFHSAAGLLGLARHRQAERAALERACHWLEKIGLRDCADMAAGALPYGSQRRLEIARAMCADPVFLCLDEPAAGLNPHESHGLAELLLAIRRENGIAILLIEHDMRVVMQISDHVVVLDHGACIASGTPTEIRANAAVIRAYLGAPDHATEAAAC